MPCITIDTKYLIPVAIVIAIIVAVALYLSFKSEKMTPEMEEADVLINAINSKSG